MPGAGKPPGQGFSAFTKRTQLPSARCHQRSEGSRPEGGGTGTARAVGMGMRMRRGREGEAAPGLQRGAEAKGSGVVGRPHAARDSPGRGGGAR